MVDILYNNVSLLLHGNGLPGSDVFIDSGPFNYAVQAGGSAAINTEDSKFGGASIYLNGADDCLLIDATPAFNFGIENYTIEAWVNVSAGTGGSLCSMRFDGATGWALTIGSNGSTAYRAVIGGQWIDGFNATPPGTVPLNVWCHIAFVRNGNLFTTYVNGIAISSVSNSGALSYSGAPLLIGAGTFNTREAPFQGWIDEFRITKGAARYIANFTPPALEFANTVSDDPLYSSVKLLLRGDGDNDSFSFVDGSITPKTIVRGGNAKISTTQSVDGGSSMYFDGVGDYLTLSNNDGLFPNGVFTLETWVYVEQLDISQRIGGFATTSGGDTTCTLFISADNRFGFGGTDGVSYKIAYSTTLASIGTWMHVAGIIEGNYFKLYINGVLEGTSLVFGALVGLSSIFAIGRVGYYDGQYFKGYLDNLRITNGSARYTANFTPSVSFDLIPEIPPEPPEVIYDEYYGYVTLLMHGDGVNGSLVFTDNSNYVKQIYPYDDAVISTTQSKFGGSSMSFGGAGGCAVLNYASTDYDFGGSDFTIETSVFITGSLSIYQPILSNTKWTLMVDSDQGSLVSFSCNVAGDAVIVTSASPPPVNQWLTISVTRSGSSLSMFIDGVLVNTSVISGAISNSSQPLGIGGNSRGSPSAQALGTFTGYIDELRITKGIARYTGTYVLPTVAYGHVQGVQQPSNPTLYDLHYNNVDLLMHTVGNPDSISFVDASRHASYIGNQLAANPYANQFSVAATHKTETVLYATTYAYFPENAIPLEPEMVLGYSVGTGDFTIEFSLYVPTGSRGDTTSNIFSLSYQTTGTNGNLVDYNSLQIFFGDSDTNGRLSFSVGSNNLNALRLTDDTRDTLVGQFCRFAMVRRSGVVTVYKDGYVQMTSAGPSVAATEYSYFDNTSITDATYLLIGGDSALSLTEIRFTSKIARYSPNQDVLALSYVSDTGTIFADQAAISENDPVPDPYYDNVTLLLHAASPPSSLVIVDSSRHNSAIANISQITHSANVNLFPNTVTTLYFPLNALPIEPAILQEYAVGYGDFTVEFAVWINSGYIAEGSSTIFTMIYDAGDDEKNFKIGFDSDAGSGRLGFSVSNFTDPDIRRTLDTRDTLVGAWHRFAMVRHDGVVTVYKNGMTINTGAGASIEAPDMSYNNQTNITLPTRIMLGAGDFYLSEFRFTSGVARYLQNYDVATTRFAGLVAFEEYVPPVDPGPILPDVYYENVVLLIHGSGVPFSEEFVDSSAHASFIRNQGVNRHDAGQSLYSSTSAYFPHRYADWDGFPLKPEVIPDYAVGTTDFTLEFSVYINSVGGGYIGEGYNNLFTILYGVPGTGEGSLSVSFNDDLVGGRLAFNVNGNALNNVINIHTTQHTRMTLLGAWHRFAMVRHDGLVTVYKNGSRQNTGAGITTETPDVVYYDATSIDAPFEVQVGGNSDTYLANVRFTGGIARYLGEYTPSTTIFGHGTPPPITLESRLFEFATAIGNDIRSLNSSIVSISSSIEDHALSLGRLERIFSSPVPPTPEFPAEGATSSGSSFTVTPYVHADEIPQYGLQIRRGINSTNMLMGLEYLISRSNPNTTSTVSVVAYSQLDNRAGNGTPIYWQARYIDIFGNVGEWGPVATYIHSLA